MIRSLTPLFALTFMGTISFACLAQSTNAPSPISPITATAPSLNGIQEHKLANGLTILTQEVHSAPVVYFSIWYRVGSINEQLGQTGMSHLLEHMMFKGTKTRKPGSISALLQQNGASYNANTFFDRTAYFETIASDRLEMAMQLESDRMVNSLFDPAEHQREMSVVRSEYEGGENNPAAALGKAVRLAAYQVHPYRWQTIGFRSDIENISRQEMYDYYKKYYVPNNATIVMVGDFNTKTALAQIEKYFGRIPQRPITPSFITPEPEQEGERRVLLSRAGASRIVDVAYHIPQTGHPDRYALDVLEGVLSGGRTSRFFDALVQRGLASSAWAYSMALRDPDLFNLTATAQPGKTNQEIEKALLEEIEKVQATPVSPEELARVIRQSEANYIYGQDSVESMGSQLGENAARGDWRYGETYLENVRRVTAADVQRVAQKYLVERNRTVGYFEPASLQTANQSVGAVNQIESKAPPALVRANAKIRPHDALATPVAAKATRTVLDNGITVIVQENHANPTVSVSGAMLSAGDISDPEDKPGLASFTASQLARGTKTRSLTAMARALEDVGASVEVDGGQEYVSFGGRALTRDYDGMTTILADQLRNPVFPEDELEKARQQALAGIDQARQDTGTLARIAFTNAIYPPGHPYHTPTLDEQAATLKSLTRDDLVSFHKNHYAPERLVITIVGDIDTANAISSIQRTFGDWTRNGTLPAIAIPDVSATAGKSASAKLAKPVVINLADKAQSDVIYGYAGHLKRTDPDYYAVQVMNTILGVGLPSRLLVNVRDRDGLVYSISSTTEATLGAGPFFVSFGSNPQNVDKAVTSMRRQIALARDKGFSKEEVEKAVSYITGVYAVTMSNNSSVARQLLNAEVYGLGTDYIRNRNSYFQKVTAEQVSAAAAKYLDPDLGTLVIAGTNISGQ